MPGRSPNIPENTFVSTLQVDRPLPPIVAEGEGEAPSVYAKTQGKNCIATYEDELFEKVTILPPLP
jgi:hypothetical protein